VRGAEERLPGPASLSWGYHTNQGANVMAMATQNEGIQDLLADMMVVKGIAAYLISKLPKNQQEEAIGEALSLVRSEIESRRDLLAASSAQNGQRWMERVQRQVSLFEQHVRSTHQV
jgi:hypothetical protein